MSIAADAAPLGDALLNYGFAGVLLAVLFWFLRALVVFGVRPFVESTLKNQAALVSLMEAVRSSAEKTALLVGDMHQRLSSHMNSDEAKDREILEILRKQAAV